MNIEIAIKEIIAEIKKMDLNHLKFKPDANFIEELNLDSFEVVSFVDKLETTFNVDFGAQSIDFDSLKSWSALLTNIENKINNKIE